MQKVKPEGLELQERLISVSRVSKVVKEESDLVSGQLWQWEMVTE